MGMYSYIGFDEKCAKILDFRRFIENNEKPNKYVKRYNLLFITK